MTTLAGLEVKPSDDMTRIQAVCEHQRGLIYVVPAERSWVCTAEMMPAHALAGFFRELVALKSPEVEGLMRQWGLYYRQLPAQQGRGRHSVGPGIREIRRNSEGGTLSRPHCSSERL